MKKTLLSIGLVMLALASHAAPPPTVSLDLVVPQNGSLENGTVYKDLDGNSYVGVRVGEYYWMNTNINYPLGAMPNTKAQVDLLHERYVMFDNWRPPQEPTRRDGSYWEVMQKNMGTTVDEAMKDIDQYYGQYYSLRPATAGIFDGAMKEDGALNTTWGLPSPSDLLQLVGMCGDGSLHEIRRYLSFNFEDPTAPPFARINNYVNSNIHDYKSLPYYWWFTGCNNKYGLNFVPAGYKFERPDGLSTENYGTIVQFDAQRGDLGGFNQALYVYTKPAGVLILHDYADMEYYTNFQSYPARYCRQLTDTELGYKIYASISGNTGNVEYPQGAIPQYYEGGMHSRSQDEQLGEYIKHGLVKSSDVKIIKLGLTETPPSGYVELSKGMLRGLYVQHIMEGNNAKTVEEIVNLAIANDRFLMIREDATITIKARHYNTGAPINGGKYKIQTSRGNKIYGPDEYTISSKGEIVISNLPAPEYYIISEVEAPPGYESNDLKVEAEFFIWRQEVNRQKEVVFDYGRDREETDLYFSTSDQNNIIQTYKGVRIGEYMWMNSNLYNPAPLYLSQDQINKALTSQGIDPADYPITPTEFRRYFGADLSVGYNYGTLTGAKIYEGENKELTGWTWADPTAFFQLFGMCGDALPASIHTYLGAKEGDNPYAKNVGNVSWFTNNLNVYDFNLMPGGARVNGATGSYNEGDIYDLFTHSYFMVNPWWRLVLTSNNMYFTQDAIYHWATARWCRKLTDEELGYKLYINSTSYDDSANALLALNGKEVNIVKLPLGQTPPEGYGELVNGYLRGLYVQNMIDKPYLKKTIPEIVKEAGKARGVSIDVITSIEQEVINPSEAVSSVDVFPNPVKDVLNVKSEKNILSLEIYNMSGQLMLKESNVGTNRAVWMNSYSKGIYILNIRTENGVQSRKIHKQ